MAQDQLEGALQQGRLTAEPLVDPVAVRRRGSPGDLVDPQRRRGVSAVLHHIANPLDLRLDLVEIAPYGCRATASKYALIPATA